VADSLEIFNNKLNSFWEESQKKLTAFKSVEDLELFRQNTLGKKGKLTLILKQLATFSKDQKPLAGQAANVVREKINSSIVKLKLQLEEEEFTKKLLLEKVDPTLPGVVFTDQHPHPITAVEKELVELLSTIGFDVSVGPEVEHEFYNFDALNIPKSHPSRALQDTFYMKDHPEIVLRTQTSPIQIRTMMKDSPPIRMICPGRVYRSDYDATHSPMFHQLEGLLVDKDVNMGDLKGVLQYLINNFFGQDLKMRLRPSYFPFTEPSAEVDMECCFCNGDGCKVCKNTGWIEVMGCGMVDPEVFKSVNLDFSRYKGFAWGLGVERFAMLKYGINDLRSFYESDSKFIHQFGRWL